ncbi:histidine phosphatase family protein [Olivibacter sp. XZL3]|uniref:SixA phosphatase family protein n=1 Tax=Olivibacter sp. XZL3 TaxID=1735116 RepID=UPI00106598A2|nr:histidine phosphatase family protein [Olivibacter sp. XZL3]
MAKYLYLIRHAKSDWSYDLPDFERPLNKRGLRDAPIMAERLALQNLRPDWLISSPANRAISTAKIFAEELRYPSDEIQEESAIYEANVPSLLQVINSFRPEVDCVALFGHNPGISLLAEYLCENVTIDFPTCAIAFLSFETDNWEEISVGTGSLVWFNYPKLV